jgi:hypothetical protein
MTTRGSVFDRRYGVNFGPSLTRQADTSPCLVSIVVDGGSGCQFDVPASGVADRSGSEGTSVSIRPVGQNWR